MKFNELAEKHLQTLEKYVPVVDRVHGKEHPEFHDVKAIYDTIVRKLKSQSTDEVDLTSEFDRLREITDKFTVPGDVCVTYEAVYKMLEELDGAYRKK